MFRPLRAAALAALVSLALAAPADAARRQSHHAVRAHGHLRLHSPIEAPQPVQRQAPVTLPSTTSRPVWLGRPPVAPNVPNNLPPVNTPQPPL